MSKTEADKSAATGIISKLLLFCYYCYCYSFVILVTVTLLLFLNSEDMPY